MNIDEKTFVCAKREEGLELKPYLDSEGYPTIGIGTLLGSKCSLEDLYSRYQFEITEEIAQIWFKMRMNQKVLKLEDIVWYKDLNEDRQVIIRLMAYQIGVGGVLKFTDMIACLKAKNWNEAAKAGADSVWFNQSPKRAQRELAVIVSGDLKTSYNELFNE